MPASHLHQRFHHPAVGDLTIALEGLPIPDDPGLMLTALSAEPGTASHDGHRLSASRAATVEQPSTGLVAGDRWSSCPSRGRLGRPSVELPVQRTVCSVIPTRVVVSSPSSLYSGVALSLGLAGAKGNAGAVRPGEPDNRY
ncbi:hypothetical protein [Streptomyces sp. SID13726]|uniref:MmyB family transcriptional regulator n=1 Tax=Streptomyces sp. SID13726 TaxID=2706058 RepID=UPI0031BB6059